MGGTPSHLVFFHSRLSGHIPPEILYSCNTEKRKSCLQEHRNTGTPVVLWLGLNPEPIGGTRGMVTKINNVKPSADIRAELAATGEPVCLAFSTGKDSIAAWIALKESGVKNIYPAFLYFIPGLKFIEDEIKYYEDFFQQKIWQFPHPGFFAYINSFVFQPPERLAIIEAANLPNLSFEDSWKLYREAMGVPEATWVADGVRAADSPLRRIVMTKHGAMNFMHRKFSAVWDWQIADVRASIARTGVRLPVDYEMFGRTFDGIDHRFSEPLRERFPDDYARCQEWFPLMDMERARRELFSA